MERMNIKKLTDLLMSLPKDMVVNVFSTWQGKYINDIHVWAEGHDHRHFIELMKDEWNSNSKPTTVEKILNNLNKCYTKFEKEYRDGIYVTIDAPLKYRSSTSIIKATIKNGELFLKGDKPSWVN